MASADEPLSGMYWTELREVTAIQPGSAVDGSEALMTVDDGPTRPSRSPQSSARRSRTIRISRLDAAKHGRSRGLFPARRAAAERRA
jgi:hypothetical protein